MLLWRIATDCLPTRSKIGRFVDLSEISCPFVVVMMNLLSISSLIALWLEFCGLEANGGIGWIFYISHIFPSL